MKRSHVVVRLALLIAALLVVSARRTVSAQSDAEAAGKILFQKGSELYLMKADGSDVTNLTNTPDLADFDSAWSPDGTHIVFVSDRDATEGQRAMAAVFNLYVMDADGSNVQPLTSGLFRDTVPAFSPNGTRIAFSRTTPGIVVPTPQVWIMNADGSDAVQITHNEEPYQIGDLAWTADGKSLIWTALNGNGVKPSHTFVVDVASGAISEQPLDQPIAAGAAWSPVAQKFIYKISDPAQEDAATIYLNDVDTAEVTPLLKLPYAIPDSTLLLRDAAEFSWSPDGAWIAFEAPEPRDSRAVFLQIMVMSADGTNFRLLTTDQRSGSAHPRWQPTNTN
ncbi:MAG: PD40 domain-containing protein [Anaerolineae bacterium]|nr:PD40 domain-containing protein [Anaerolineae bacterium]